VARAVVADQGKKVEQLAPAGVGGQKGALPLPAHDQVSLGQFVQGLAHRALADAVFLGKLGFGGQAVSGLPGAVNQMLHHLLLDQRVQRPHSRSYSLCRQTLIPRAPMTGACLTGGGAFVHHGHRPFHGVSLI